MNWFTNVLRVLGPRLISAGAAIVVVKAAEKGITLDPTETAGALVGVYAMLHKAISSKVNPGDAASGRVAIAEKSAANDGGTVVVERPK